MNNLSPETKSNKPLRFGSIGIRGYGGSVFRLLAEHQIKGDAGIRFVAACDPAPHECGNTIEKYRDLNIRIVAKADELLAMDLDAVWLPLPIHLHQEYTAAALDRGIAVICEKPAAGCVKDVDAMIASRDRAGLPVLVAFHHLFDPAVLELKQALVDGRHGQITRAVVFGCWPRDKHYYQRNDWAGRKQIGKRIVNDSPASNAMAHFIMLAMFLAGQTPDLAAQVKSVQPHLYRAADIETYDTVSMRITTTDDVDIDVHLTHASRSEVPPTVTVYTDRGQISLTDEQDMIIEAGSDWQRLPWGVGSRRQIAPTLAGLLRGEIDVYRPASLENARQHVVACELASANAVVNPVAMRPLVQAGGRPSQGVAAITDIEVMISECVRNGQLLSTLTR